jgi:phosphocarrier protein
MGTMNGTAPLPGRNQESDAMNGLSALTATRPEKSSAGARTDHAPAAGPPAVRTAGADDMNVPSLHQTVVVRNPQGLHMRAALFFVQQAGEFQSAVAVWKADQRANGKSLWDLMLLAATQGTELILEVSGADATAALPVLAEALSAPGSVFDDPGASKTPPKG